MRQGLSRTKHLSRESQQALAQYLAALAQVYPEGAQHCQIIPWAEYGVGSYLVKVPVLEDEQAWIQVSEQMAEVGTRILVESDQLFVLTV
jgi:hypothetical protein